MNNLTGQTLLIEKMIQSLPVDCYVLHHSALVLLCDVPMDNWLLCDVPKSKLVNKFDLKRLQIKVSDNLYVSWMLFCDENIKCIHTSPFGLVFWPCVAFLYEEEGRRVGQNCGKGQKRQINVSQAAMASMISLKGGSYMEPRGFGRRNHIS